MEFDVLFVESMDDFFAYFVVLLSLISYPPILRKHRRWIDRWIVQQPDNREMTDNINLTMNINSKEHSLPLFLLFHRRKAGEDAEDLLHTPS